MIGRALTAAAVLAVNCLLMPAALAAQTPPALSKNQRELLQAVVQAVDAAATQPDTPDALRAHVMRASDGSHYVAFSLSPSAAAALPAGPVALYVRLATAAPVAAAAERSAMREWLASNAATPPVAMTRFVDPGEMPIFGAAGNFTQRSPVVAGSTALQLMDLDRQRVRDQQAAKDAQRRAELDGSAAIVRDMMPFEDFDLAAPAATIGGVRTLARALTAGPGDYALTVGWADPNAPSPAATVRVMKTALRLPAATEGLALSSIILADAVRVRSTPYPPAEQTAHPYAIGLTEIFPAADSQFKGDEQLAVAFQIINARPADNGKPEVEVTLEVVTLQAGREQTVATLKSQSYTGATVPPDFDLRVGHPLIAAISAPLTTLKPGAYQLKIAANDRLAGRVATATAGFTIAATAMSLLSEAPALAPPFRADPFVGPEILPYVMRTLRPASPSAALGRALDAAAAGRFTDLLDEPVAESEEGVRAALRGLSLLALGDGSAAVHFQRAALLGAPPSATRLLSGAARALQDRDADAIAAWQEALAARAPWPLVAPFLLDAHVRRGDFPRAAALIAETREPPTTAAWTRSVAATQIAMRKEGEAVIALDRQLAKLPDDEEARWLLLHALYSQFAHGDTANRRRLATELRAYADRNATHAGLAREWLTFVDAQGTNPK